MDRATAGIVTELWRYPVKSMLGERIERADVTAAGIAGDRSAALVDAETGKVVSAKRPSLWGRLFDLTAGIGDDGRTTVTFPDGDACILDAGAGDDHDDAVRKLSSFIGRDVRVARTAAQGATYEETWDPAKEDSPLYGQQIADEDGQPVVTLPTSPVAPAGTFFDFSAIHVVTTSSLAALRGAYPEGDVDVRRFRPNLLVEVPDEDGFIENDWASAKLEVGGDGLVLDGIMATMRCVMTTLAQPGLTRDPGILQATNRANRISVPGMGDYACLGVFCRVARSGSVTVGDEVRVSPRG